jgi:hypothetical protein
MADWGQGALNNNIGWGKGADNNISWGISQKLSYSGDTNITGILAIVENLISTFKIRVANDGGIFEAEQCLRDLLTILNET